MTTKKSTVETVIFKNTWNSKRDGKTFYAFTITMENGDVGEYSSVTDKQEKFIEGQEVEYTFIDGDFPKIKPYYPGGSTYTYSNNKSSDSEQIARSVAMKAMTEYGICKGWSIDKIIEEAERVVDYIINGKKDSKDDSFITTDSTPF